MPFVRPIRHRYRFLSHDCDSIFSAQLDRSIQNLGLRVLNIPSQSAPANTLCERLLGPLWRDCLDDLLPVFANHV
jgi:hypothetical protein